MPDPSAKICCYVVAAISERKFVTLTIRETGVDDRRIHNTLATMANGGRLGMDFTTSVLAGSFNFRRIYTAKDTDDAIARAKAGGLKFEPIADVHARTMREIEAAAQKSSGAAPGAPASNPVSELERLMGMFGGRRPA